MELTTLSSAPEIKEYFLSFQAKYKLQPYIQYSSRVLSADWNEAEGKYHVLVRTSEGTKRDWCNVLVNGSGVLNSWKCKILKPDGCDS